MIANDMKKRRQVMPTDKKEVTKLVQEAIDKGASSAEEIHRAIADLPITVLENLGVAGETTKSFKNIQDTTIGAIYELVHDINHSVTDLASDLLKTAEKSTASSTKKEKTEA
jgi:hypothetical protein